MKLLNILMLSAILCSCSKNIYTDFLSEKDKFSDESLAEDAKKYLNNGDYTSSINSILKMSENGQKMIQNQNILGSAYAGRCGLDLIQFSQNLATASGTVFSIMLSLVKTIDVSPEDCLKAQKIFQNFGDASQRTTDQNIFLFFLGLTKGGAYLKAKIDLDGNGLQDSANIVCRSPAVVLTQRVKPSDGSLDSSQVNADGTIKADMENIITSLGLIIENIDAVATSVLGPTLNDTISGAIQPCVSFCKAKNSAMTDSACRSSCTMTEESVIIDKDFIQLFRGLLNSSALGVGSCTDVNLNNCCPP